MSKIIMDANKNNGEMIDEFIVDKINESISDALESLRSDLYVMVCQALINGIKIGKTRYQPNNAQCIWHDVNSCLPEEGKRVGVLTKDGAMFFGCVFNGSFPSGVTHWLDIPEIPPKN